MRPDSSSLELARVRRNVDSVLLEHFERNYVEGTFVCRGQHDGRRCSVLMREEPIPRRDAPAVAGHQTWETVLRHRADQIVPDAALVFEELGRDDSTDRVAVDVLGAGIAAPVAVPTRNGVEPARLEVTAKHIAFGHHAKYGDFTDIDQLPGGGIRQNSLPSGSSITMKSSLG